MHFPKDLVVCSSAGPKILDFGSHCSANFQPILDCFIPNFKLKYEHSENIKADPVSTVVCNLHQIKRRACFLEHPVCTENTEAQKKAVVHFYLGRSICQCFTFSLSVAVGDFLCITLFGFQHFYHYFHS